MSPDSEVSDGGLALRGVKATSSACAVQAECGGCPLMPLGLEEQSRAKLSLVVKALARHAIAQRSIAWTASPRALGYRNRVRLRVTPGGEIGFFNPEKVASCAVLEPGLRLRFEALLALSRSQPGLFRGWQHLELRADDALGRPGLALGGPTFDGELVERSRAIAERLTDHSVGVRGDPQIAWQQRGVLDTTLFVPLDAFLQVNDGVNALLVAAVRDGMLARGASRALDLYAGAGNFSLPLARAGLTLTAVELHGGAARALSAAADAQGLTCHAMAGSAPAVAAELCATGRRFDAVIVDAPRAGAREAVAAIAALEARWVVICSCRAESFARDVAGLGRAGYRLEELRAFDMFPHTDHVELLGWLSRE